MLRRIEKTHSHKSNRRNLKYLPGNGDSGSLTGSPIVDNKCQHCSRNESAEVRGIVDKPTAQITDEQIDQNYRKHSCAERTLETFRQFVAKLDAKNKQNSDQPEERS